MKKLVIMMLLVATQTSLLAQAPKVVVSDKEGWHKIGETTVDFTKETDEILIIGANKFSSLKIKVTDAPINLGSFDIIFDNNEKQKVAVGQEFKTPGETKQISFGGEKTVKSVVFSYKTINSNADEKAHVELWGYKTNP